MATSHISFKKILSFLAIGLLLIPLITKANHVLVSETITVQVPMTSGPTPITLQIAGSATAAATSIEVSDNTLTLTFDDNAGDMLTIISTNKFRLNNGYLANNTGTVWTIECTANDTRISPTSEAGIPLIINPVAVTYDCPTSGSGGGTAPSGSGGGGGGMSLNPSTVGTTESSTTEIFHSPIKLNSNALLVRPALIENLAHGATIFLQKDTVVKKMDGNLYSMGTIGIPSIVGNNKFTSQAQLPPELKLIRVISIPTDENIQLQFSKPVTVKIPMPENINAKELGLKVYWYDEAEKKFTLANGGGTPSDDGKFINVTVDKLKVLGAAIEGELPQEIPTEVTVETSVPFEDMVGHWAEEYTTKLSLAGVVKGREEGKYVPNGVLTRAELLKIALLTFGYEITEGDVPTFTDVEPDAWYASVIATGEAEDIVKGRGDGAFGPNDPVTRAEAMKILVEASEEEYEGAEAAPFTDVKADDWFASYVNFAYSNEIVKGKSATKFAPHDPVTRAEMAKMAVLMFEFGGGEFPTLDVEIPAPKSSTSFDAAKPAEKEGPVAEFAIPSDGIFTKDVLLVNDTTGVRMSVTKDVSVTQGLGSTVKAGIFGFLSQAPVAPSTLKLYKTIQFPVSPSADVTFDKPVWFTLPMPAGIDPKNVHVYMWHESSGYTLFGDGGKVSDDGKTISVLGDHIPYLVIAKDLSVK